MSRIDELQRLHEAAVDGFLDTRLGMVCSEEVRESIVALHNSWPAIHRVLVAARRFLDQANVIGIYRPKHMQKCEHPGPNYDLELTQYADTYNDLTEALRALDGGLPADQ